MAGLEERTIGMLSFPYTRVRQVNGEERRSIAYALRGETVPLLPEDIERGDRLGAFNEPAPVPTSSEELQVALERNRSSADPWVSSPAVAQEAHLLPAAERPPEPDFVPLDSDDDLTAFVAESNADDVIDRAENEPDLAAPLLEAERAREKPRKTVVEALEKVVDPA